MKKKFTCTLSNFISYREYIRVYIRSILLRREGEVEPSRISAEETRWRDVSRDEWTVSRVTQPSADLLNYDSARHGFSRSQVICALGKCAYEILECRKLDGQFCGYLQIEKLYSRKQEILVQSKNTNITDILKSIFCSH